MRIIGNDQARFDFYASPEALSGCWLWTGALDGHGYGHFWMDGEIMKAHRASWILHRGAIPDGKWLLHRCDNPACVNPIHLFLGDRTANMRDMAAKGRQVFQVSPERAARGSGVFGSRLEEGQVATIKRELARGVSLARIAREYGVCKATIGHIRSGKNWAHIQP